MPRTDVKPFKKPPEVPAKPDILRKPAVPPRNFVKVRGRLDKSHSTPAYDTSQEDKPPEKLRETARTPEILITEVSDTDINLECKYNEIDHPYTQIEYHDLPQESTPVVETINSALEIKENDEIRTYKSTIDDVQKIRPKMIDKPSKNDIKPEPPPRSVYMQDKKFEPKSMSTPISKTSGVEFPNVENRTLEVKTDTKISPTNSVVRAMIYSNKSRSGKKKSALLASKYKVFTIVFIIKLKCLF